jgi:hypothetical protein
MSSQLLNRSFSVMARAPTALVPVVALALLASAIFAAPALGSARDVIRDCSEDGVLNGNYSHSELAKALDQLPSDLDEYTDCRAVIRDAELRSARKGKGGPGVGPNVDTTSPPSADEQRKLSEAAKSTDPVHVGGQPVTPGFRAAGVGGDLPPLVLAVLLALFAAMATGGALALKRHRPGFAGTGPLAEPIRRITTAVKNGIARFRR